MPFTLNIQIFNNWLLFFNKKIVNFSLFSMCNIAHARQTKYKIIYLYNIKYKIWLADCEGNDSSMPVESFKG